MGNLDRQAKAKQEKPYQSFIDLGVDILATDRPIEAAEALGVIPDKNVSTKYYRLRVPR